MIKTFTQTDLIRYLYQETTEEEAQEISKAIANDPELKAAYDDLASLPGLMDNSILDPAPSTVLNILTHLRNGREKI